MLVLIATALISQVYGCSSVFFLPDQKLVRDPGAFALEFEDVWIDTEDGHQIHGWFMPGEGPPKGTVIFLHGNAQNISYHMASVAWLVREQYNVFLYDYRGFGNSSGKSNFSNAIDDFAFVLSKLKAFLPRSEQRFIVFGQSLGASLSVAAIHANREEPALRGLILDSAFAGFRDIAREKLNGLIAFSPVSSALALAIPRKPELLEQISDLPSIPILFIHGGKDTIIPIAHSIRLFEQAREPKYLWIEPDAPHIAALRNPALRAYFVSFLDQAFSDPVSPIVRE